MLIGPCFRVILAPLSIESGIDETCICFEIVEVSGVVKDVNRRAAGC